MAWLLLAEPSLSPVPPPPAAAALKSGGERGVPRDGEPSLRMACRRLLMRSSVAMFVFTVSDRILRMLSFVWFVLSLKHAATARHDLTAHRRRKQISR